MTKTVVRAITPVGVFEAEWLDGDDELPSYNGSAEAIAYFRAYLDMSMVTGIGGRRLQADTLSPGDMIGFVDSEEFGIKVQSDEAMEMLPVAMMEGGSERPSTLFDSVNPLERVRLSATAARLVQTLSGSINAIARIRAAKELAELLARLGVTSAPAARRDTSGFYSFSETATKGARQKANNAAIAILKQVRAGELKASDLTDEHRSILAKYTGNGGSLIGADGKKGSAYEYYTPKPIAEGIWEALKELGFNGGKVLDPCAGVGIFGATAPMSAVVDAVELDETSGGINSLVNDGAGYTTRISPFEAIAAATPDESYDAVVTNVPFGSLADRGGKQLLDKKYQRDTLEAYFILRSLTKLKPGGLAAFLVPPRCTSGKDSADVRLRERASMMAEFLGAFRLPNKVFGAASADTITDVIFFRKFSRDAAEKIEELRAQSPETLSEANVLWGEYLEGRYFLGEGKRFVLGEFQAKDPNKFRDVDRVNNPASIPEISRMLRKLPGSRINWDLLNATETAPITYEEGDTITQGGATLQMKGGSWVVLDSTGDGGRTDALLGEFKDAYTAFDLNKSIAEALQLRSGLAHLSRATDIPTWLAAALRSVDGLEPDRQQAIWRPMVVGGAVLQVLEENGYSSGTNFLETYQALSAAMAVTAPAATKLKGLKGYARDAIAALTLHYRKKQYSGLWRGDVAAAPAAVASTTQSGFEGLMYLEKSQWVSLEKASAALGEEFNPFESDDWCLSADGKTVCKADDYYTGNYGEFLAQIDSQIAAATDEKVKEKLVRQRAIASSRVDMIDPARITFNLFTPYATLEEKADFLRRFVHPTAAVVTTDAGDRVIDFDMKKSDLSDELKLIRRVGAYLKTRSATLGGIKLDSMNVKAAHMRLQQIIRTANEQFNTWARKSPVIMARLQARAADPMRLYFRQIEDERLLNIPGMSGAMTLHPYQASYVRRQGREFGGINGFDVGLGKTITALASVQHVQSMGVKKKAGFIVPNSVLSKWRATAVKAYSTVDDCLFVGLREVNGDWRTVSSAYDEDLMTVLENRHSKIFMTMEAFERIKLRDETIERFGDFMRTVDTSFAETESKKDDERTKGKLTGLLAVLGNKTGAAPYFEDMGFDSIVADEAHCYKNSAKVVEFKGAKYLSVSEPAKRGLDAQAKFWFVRDTNRLGDGILLLTATPITNSPLEIYSMNALAIGHERINNILLGTRGADDFMNTVCSIMEEEDESMDGLTRTTNVFQGLSNVSLLKAVVDSVATIKTIEDVGEQIVQPDAEEQSTDIALPPEVKDRLIEYKLAYRWAVDDLNKKEPNRGDFDAFQAVSDRLGEPQELIGHPFNLISKMTALIADPELDDRLTRYLVADGKAEAVTKLVDKWNAKPPTEERRRPGPNATAEEATKTKTIKDEDTGFITVIYTMPVKAWVADNSIKIDTISPDIQDKFEEMAESMGVDLDVTVPAKLAALIENFQTEAAKPRGVDAEGNHIPYAKQLIFCDILPMHNKIRRALVKRCGVPQSSIAIITGTRNGSPEEILQIQDDFNAPGERNKYRVVIANEKAEVGIDLQQGTQAIHHLTIGWTPDSQQQRNGRGVRQGNQTPKVNIYHYDAGGTFDKAKRTIVNSKDNWISRIVGSSKVDNVEIVGGMSREQQDALIESIGDADAITRAQEQMAAQEALARANTNRAKQVINLETIASQKRFLAENSSARGWIGSKLAELMVLKQNHSKVIKRLQSKISETGRAKLESALEGLKARIAGLERLIDESALFSMSGQKVSASVVVAEFMQNAKRGESSPGDLQKAVAQGRYIGYKQLTVEPNEESELVSDWASEVHMAKEMIAESISSYEKQADHDGALPREAAAALADGSGMAVSGKPVFVGCFIRHADRLLYVTGVSAITGQASVVGRRGSGVIDTYLSDSAIAEGEVIYPRDADAYRAACLEAAQFEDEWDKEGKTVTTFSDKLPEVAALRKREVLTLFDPAKYHLPPPYFPVAVKDDGRLSPLLQSIADSQASVVHRWEMQKSSYSYRDCFVSNSSLEVIEPRSSEAVISGLYGKAKASGLRMSAYEASKVGLQVAHITQYLARMAGISEEFIAGMSGDTPEEFEAEAKGKVIAAMAALFNEEDAKSTTWWPSWIGFAIGRRAREIRKAIEDAASASQADNESPAPASTFSATDKVNIKGDTRKWKDRIKSVAERYGKAMWRSDSWRVAEHKLTWEVSYSAWEDLIKQFPQAIQDLSLVQENSR